MLGSYLQSIMLQIFDQVVLVQVQERLCVHKLRKVLPDETVDLVQKSPGVEDRRNFPDVQIGLEINPN